jgi:hypothetical protein
MRRDNFTHLDFVALFDDARFSLVLLFAWVLEGLHGDERRNGLEFGLRHGYEMSTPTSTPTP